MSNRTVITIGLLVNGVWREQGYDIGSYGELFVRKASQFCSWLIPDAPVPQVKVDLEWNPKRDYLYVSSACTWVHQTLIFRVMEGLKR